MNIYIDKYILALSLILVPLTVSAQDKEKVSLFFEAGPSLNVTEFGINAAGEKYLQDNPDAELDKSDVLLGGSLRVGIRIPKIHLLMGAFYARSIALNIIEKPLLESNVFTDPREIALDNTRMVGISATYILVNTLKKRNSIGFLLDIDGHLSRGYYQGFQSKLDSNNQFFTEELDWQLNNVGWGLNLGIPISFGSTILMPAFRTTGIRNKEFKEVNMNFFIRVSLL